MQRLILEKIKNLRKYKKLFTGRYRYVKIYLYLSVIEKGTIMIDIDSRPDLRYLLVELNNYNCEFIDDDKILIPIPQFQKKTNEEWYGLLLICKQNSLDIKVYIYFNENNYSYLRSFENLHHLQLSTIVNESLELSTICSKCGTKTKLNDMYSIKHKHICANCFNKIKSDKR